MSSILKVDQIQLADGSTPTAGDLGLNTTGNVLQVVNVSYSDQLQTTASAYISSGLTATITPKSTNSKILILSSFEAQITGSSNLTGYFTVFRGSSNLAASGQFIRLEGNLTNWFGSQSINHLDSPNTTSATTYEVRFRSQTTNLTTRMHLTSSPGSLTLIEIAG